MRPSTVTAHTKGGGAVYSIAGPVILDLNSQRDLLSTEGAYPIFQAEKLYDPLKKLFTLPNRSHIAVVATRVRILIVPGRRGHNRLICNPNTSGYEKMPFT